METDRLKIINGDMMKYIAVIPMAIGHFVSYMQSAGVITNMTWWMNILAYSSLFAPVIFFFFITEGFKYTRSKKKEGYKEVVLCGLDECGCVGAAAKWNIFDMLTNVNQGGIVKRERQVAIIYRSNYAGTKGSHSK